MRRSRTITTSVALAIAMLTAPAQASQASERGGTESGRPSAAAVRLTPSEFEAKVVKLVNKKRVARGCHKLKINKALHRAAKRHTKRMAAADELSHQFPGEPSPGQRMTNAGYHNWTLAGEVVADGYTTPKDVVQGWIDDPPHKHILLTCRFKDTGVGYAEASDGTPYWTEDFGRK